MKLSITIILLLIILGVNAQKYITGPQFKAAAEGSVDILSSHLMLFQAQSKHDKILNNISLTSRFAPSTFLINNGTIAKSSVQRNLFNFNVGYGSIEEFGFFGGMAFDLIHAGPRDKTGDRAWGSGHNEYIIYLGFAAGGFQADFGSLISFISSGTSSSDYDYNNEFSLVKPPVDTVYYTSPKKYGRAFTLYHQSGIFFMANFTKVYINGVDRIKMSDYKFSLQPLKKFLPDIYGMPFMDLIAYSPLSSYYAQYKDFYNKAFQIDEAAMKEKEFDWSPGSDGIYKKGLRASVTFHAYPDIYFKKAELAYNYFRNELTQVCGARTQFYMREHKPNISFDAFVMLSTESKKATVSLSYSYNSPDNTTFIPLPKLHVIGIQVIFGQRETAKAIIPYANSILTDEDIDD